MIKEFIQNTFEGGKAFDKRQAKSFSKGVVSTNQFGASLNFDIHSYPSLLIPVRDYELDEGYGGSETGIRTSDLAEFGQVSGSSVYAVGRKNDGTGRKIYNKSLSSSTWLATDVTFGVTAETGTGCGVPGFFLQQFDSTGDSLHWFLSGNGSTPTTSTWLLGLLDYTGSGTIDWAKKTLSLNPTIYPQGIVGQDGAVYVADSYKLHKCSNTGTVTDSIFTVSPNFKITNLCLYNSYLAIAIFGQGKSKVLLWDYANAQASEVIEWGEGALMVLENLDGFLVGVTDKYINSTLFGAGANGTGLMQVKTWSGSFSKPIEVKAYGTTARAVEQYKWVKNGVLYWYAKIPLDSTGDTFEEGLWSFGQRQSGQPYSLVVEREIAGSSFEGFWGIADYMYLPNSGDGHVSRTNSTASYTLTSNMDTVVIGAENTSIEKEIVGITQSFQPLEADQTVTLKYRKDGDTDWTTIDPSPTLEEGDMVAVYPFDQKFREIEFRRESTGGAMLTEFCCKYEELTNAIQ